MPYGSRAEDSRAAGPAACAQERPPTIMDKQIMIARRIAGSIFWDTALLMRSTRAVKPLHFTFWREHEPVNPHGEEARSAVSNHEARGPSLETPLTRLLGMRSKGSGARLIR